MAGETDLKNREAFTSLLRTVLEAKEPDSLLVSGENCRYAENVAAKIAAREKHEFSGGRDAVLWLGYVHRPGGGGVKIAKNF